MEALRLARRSGREEASREIGTPYGSPRYLSDHLEAALGTPAILALPTIPVPSPVVTDPSSPYVGNKRFILGISKLSGGDVML